MPMPVEDATHLLKRVGFGGTAAEITATATKDRATAVDDLLNATGPAEQAPAELNDPNKGDFEQLQAVSNQWLDRMATTSAPLEEKMTLFWHGHFTTGSEKVGKTKALYDQLAFYRANARGDFKVLTQGMAIQVAMLKFLDGDFNRVGHPNQNFARELMELFTLGIGNYTEQDVIEGARAWTGYNLTDDETAFLFRVGNHDAKAKTIFGITKNWDGPMMIDEILTGSKQAVMARYMARKLWEFFAHPGPPAGVVDALAQVFIDNGLQLKPLLRALFLRNEFYAPAAKQGLVRTPIEYAISLLRSMNLVAGDLELMYHLTNQGQEPFNPPNVSGWKSNGYWISTSTAAARAAFIWHLLDRANNAGKLPNFKAQTPAVATTSAFTKVQLTAPSTVTKGAVQTWLEGVRVAKDYFGDERFDLMFLVLMTPDLQVA